MLEQAEGRYRSDLLVQRAGRFRFDGFVEAGWKPAPHVDEIFVELTVGQRFPRVGHACWWVPVEEPVAESVAEQRMSWEGGPAASRAET